MQGGRGERSWRPTAGAGRDGGERATAATGSDGGERPRRPAAVTGERSGVVGRRPRCTTGASAICRRIDRRSRGVLVRLGFRQPSKLTDLGGLKPAAIVAELSRATTMDNHGQRRSAMRTIARFQLHSNRFSTRFSPGYRCPRQQFDLQRVQTPQRNYRPRQPPATAPNSTYRKPRRTLRPATGFRHAFDETEMCKQPTVPADPSHAESEIRQHSRGSMTFDVRDREQ